VSSAEAPTSSAGLPARGSRVAQMDRERLARLGLWVGVALAIMVLCWHPLPLEPASGITPSWEAGMQMALHEGITFGNHLIFTYGPLGFLSVPTLWYRDTGTIAVLYTVLLRFALALALFWGARRSYGTLGGALVAGIAALASMVVLETVPFFVFCIWMLDRVCERRKRLMLMAAGGAVAGLELLNKLSIGIELVALAVIVALFAQGRRRDHLIVTVSAMILGLLFGWIASGQSLGSLGQYAHNADQIIAGYSAAMSFGNSGLLWQFGAGLIAFVFGVLAAWQMTADESARRRWGIIALWVVFCYLQFKEGFVLHEAKHAVMFFVPVAGGFLAMRWQDGRQPFGLGMVAILLAFALLSQRGSGLEVDNPGANAASWAKQLVQVSSQSRSASIIAAGREQIERKYPLEQSTLDLLRGHTVHVEPFQTAVVWAYRLAWRPLPVFQSYAAYTTYLDHEDADTLSSARAPQRILRNLDSDIDYRVQSFDQGMTTRTMLCRYQELQTTERWQVLGLGPNRCVGAPVSLGSVHASWGQKVRVPAPPNDHSFVFVRIAGVQVAGVERLYGLLYKPPERLLLLDGQTHRLIEGTAADGLVLRAPAAADFSRPFNVAPDATTITVAEIGGGRTASKPITYSFFVQSLSAGPRSARPAH